MCFGNVLAWFDAKLIPPAPLCFCSLYPRGLPSCRNCEFLNASLPLQQRSGRPASWTGPTTNTASTSSLGLLELLQQHGICGSLYPQHSATQQRQQRQQRHRGDSAVPCSHTAGGHNRSPDARQSVFSLNLVEKLQGLGLHRVAAWGMNGRK